MTGQTRQLYPVHGGELIEPTGNACADPTSLDIGGMFQSCEAWRSAGFQAVDNALARYRVVPLF